MTAGLDAETLDLVLASVRTFARERLGDRVVLGFEDSGSMPHDVICAMCGGELGLQPLSSPRTAGEWGRGR